MKNQTSKFRDDINGLRAWAVLAVILYHFGISGFSGGFIGVDVFFVISGFLMTGIIVSGFEKPLTAGSGERFSIISFYLSRARRILPALIALCLFTLTLGWLMLSPVEYRALGTHVITALGFFSNIQFWREAGYFDAASHEKLLLHTWSLSVEWQFYIILPLVLFTIWKIRPGRTVLTAMVALGLLVSLILSIILSPTKPSAAFYLLPTRAWEMLAGGLIYLLASPRQLSAPARKALEASGLTLILASITLFDVTINWPGWQALVPVVGTMLVLIAARQGSLWTGSRIAQWLGDCSYSLYLWHWPFAVALVYLELQGHTGAIAVGLTLTLLFGWLSYRLIETPARNALTRMSPRRGAGVLLVFVLSVTLPSLIVRQKQGVPTRLPDDIYSVFKEIENKNPRRDECHSLGTTPVPECTYGGEKLGVIVIGDSHAQSVVRSIENSLPNKNFHALDWTMVGCPTIQGIKHTDHRGEHCGNFITHAIESQKNLDQNAPIIIINRLSSRFFGPNEPERAHEKTPDIYITNPYPSRSQEFLKEIRDGFIGTVCEFAKYRPTYIVLPTPELKKHVPNTMGRALMRGQKKEVSISLDEYYLRNAFSLKAIEVAAANCGVKLLDPRPYLCSEGRCKGDVDGLPIYYDDDHLNERGGNLLIPMFSQVFEEIKMGTTQTTIAKEIKTP